MPDARRGVQIGRERHATRLSSSKSAAQRPDVFWLGCLSGGCAADFDELSRVA
jgi:hypothetical protein